jgi:hypothetical protein
MKRATIMAQIISMSEKTRKIVAKDDEGNRFVIYMDEDRVVCPCGDSIELDGECPEGHVSPAMDLF